MAHSLGSATYSQLITFHNNYWKPHKAATITSSVGAFLIITSLVVTISACLCLTLPGINVMSAVILPGILPGTLGFTSGVILLTVGFIYRNKMKKVLIAWTAYIKTKVEETHKTERKDLLIDIISTEKTENSKNILLDALQESYPSKKKCTRKQKNILEAINQAKEAIVEDKKPKKDD